MEKAKLASMAQVAVNFRAPTVRAPAALAVQQVRSIDAPRVFHAGADDKAGYWEDFGLTTAFDFSTRSDSLVAVLDKSDAPTRLFVFDLSSGRIRFKPILSRTRRPRIGAIHLSPDGMTAAVPMGEDRQLALWNVATGSLVAAHAVEGSANDVHWHPAGGLLAVIAGKDVEIWQFTAGGLSRVRSIRASRSTTEWPMTARWSPDGEYLAIGTNVPAVYISKADGSQQSAALRPMTKGSVYMVEWNAGGDRLAAAGFGTGSEISIWKDPKLAVDSPFDQKYELLHRIAPPPSGEPWRKLTWDPLGQLLAFGEMSNLGIWDAASGRVLQSFAAHPGSAVLEAHWKGDALVTVGAYPDKNFRIWSVSR